MKRLIVPVLALAAACRPEAKLSESQEYFVGRGVAAHAMAQTKLYVKDAELERYVNLVGHTIAFESDRPEVFNGWTFGILESDEVNAFCAPSGFVFVTVGLLKAAQNEDELAGVLAHEIAHVCLRHPEIAAAAAANSTGLMEFAQELTGLVTFLGGVAAAAGQSNLAKYAEVAKEAAPAFGQALTQLNKSLQAGFSRDEELAADVLGADFMSRPGVGYNPQALADFVGRLPQKPQGAYASHPDMADRLQKLNDAVKKLGKNIPTNPSRTDRYKRYTAGLKGS
jgi:predicted Zn-dependent protease